MRVLKISRDSLPYLGGRTHEPNHDEGRHHRCDKVGIGNLPRSTVTAIMLSLLLHDDNRTRSFVQRHISNLKTGRTCYAAAASSPLPLQAFSISLKPGRTRAGMARR